MGNIFNLITENIVKILNGILGLLPVSPVQRMINAIGDIPYLNIINWFIPFDLMLVITEAWLVAVAAYYLYMIILRWVKAIE